MLSKYYMSPVKGKDVARIKSPKTLKANGYVKNIVYMQDEDSERSLLKSVSDGDIIEIHGHGTLWIFGGEQDNPKNDYTPIRLAAYFKTRFEGRKDIDLTIDLRFCNSGTRGNGDKGKVCYAKEFSRALSGLGMHNISVIGYSGFLVYDPKKPLRLKTVDNNHSEKSKNKKSAQIADAMVIYKNGQMVKAPVSRPVHLYTYSEAQSASPGFLKHLELSEKFYARIARKIKKAAAKEAQLEELRKQQQELEELQQKAEDAGIASPQSPPQNPELTPLQDAYKQQGLASSSFSEQLDEVSKLVSAF